MRIAVVWGVLLERGPSAVDRRLLRIAGAFRQPLARVRVEPGAVRLTHRLERKRQDNRVPDQIFKIHVVVLNVEVTRFVPRIREKFLELDFDRLFDVDETCLLYTSPSPRD